MQTLPPEVKLVIISHLRPSPRDFYPYAADNTNSNLTSNLLWYSHSYFLPTTISPLTQLSQTSAEWYQLCRSKIWECVNLEGIKLKGLLEFVTYLTRTRGEKNGIGQLIKALHIPSTVSYSTMRVDAFSRQLSALDGQPLDNYPRQIVAVRSPSITSPAQQGHWTMSCYQRLISILISPALTPNLNQVSLPKVTWNFSRRALMDYPRLFSQKVNHSLTTFSIDLRALDADSSTLAENLSYFTALEELSLSGDSLDDQTCHIFVSAISSLPNLSTLRLFNQSLSIFCITTCPQLQIPKLRHLDLFIPFTYYYLNSNSYLIQFLSQWSNSLQSLLLVAQEFLLAPLPSNPPTFSPSLPSFSHLRSLEVQFSNSFVSSSNLPFLQHLLQSPLPLLTPALETLTIYLPPIDFIPPLLVLPAIPSLKFTVVSSWTPSEAIQSFCKKLVEKSVEFTWITPKMAEIGPLQRRDGSRREKMTWEGERKGVWNSFKGFLGGRK